MSTQEECWLDIPGYEGLYQVSSYGRVKSLARQGARGRLLKPGLNSDNYFRVVLCSDNTKKTFSVHSLVMLAFVGERPESYQELTTTSTAKVQVSSKTYKASHTRTTSTPSKKARDLLAASLDSSTLLVYSSTNLHHRSFMSTAKRKVSVVGVESVKGKLRLRLPANATTSSSKRYIHTGLEDTQTNYQKLLTCCFEVEQELALTGGSASDEQVELWRERYFFGKLRVVRLTTHNTTNITLLDAWDLYCDYRKPQVAVTTYEKEYKRKVRNHIVKLHEQGLTLTQAPQVKEALLKSVSLTTCKRVLTYLNAMCSWLVSKGELNVSPYLGMAESVKTNNNHNEDNINPFSLQERENILNAFERHKHFKHYYPFVKFLFLTGCRTGEAVALRWENVSQDCKVVTFAESYDSQLKVRKDTKTHKTRRFPCNPVLRELLLGLERQAPQDFVFVSPKGLPLNNGKFTNQVWRGCRSGAKTYRGVVTQLVEQGLVESYRPLYNTRHTFITMCLEAGMTPNQTARLVGNSPEVILKHYCGSTLKFEVPVT